jgi:hypothetical protein
MSARRCFLCGISYPAIAQFATCPIHQEATQLAQNIEPDEDWQQQFERAKRRADADAAVREPLPQVFDVAAYEEHGQLWVDQGDLIRAGLRLARTRDDHVFQLEDDIYETLGWDEPNRRWWVREYLGELPMTTEREPVVVDEA